MKFNRICAHLLIAFITLLPLTSCKDDAPTSEPINFRNGEICLSQASSDAAAKDKCQAITNKIVQLERDGAQGLKLTTIAENAPFAQQATFLDTCGLALLPMDDVELRLLPGKLEIKSKSNAKQVVRYRFDPSNPMLLWGNSNQQILFAAAGFVSETTLSFTEETVDFVDGDGEVIERIERDDPTTFWVGNCDEPDGLGVTTGIGEMVIVDTEFCKVPPDSPLRIIIDELIRTFYNLESLSLQGDTPDLRGGEPRSMRSREAEESCMPAEGHSDCLTDPVPEENWSVGGEYDLEDVEITIIGDDLLIITVAGGETIEIDLNEYTVGFTIDGDTIKYCLGERTE